MSGFGVVRVRVGRVTRHVCGAALAAALSSGSAAASPGCDAVNSGALDIGFTGDRGVQTLSVAADFASGDVLMITTTLQFAFPGDRIVADLVNAATSTQVANTELDGADGTASDSYTIPASEVTNTFQMRADFAKPLGSDASYSVSVRCSAAAPGTGTTGAGGGSNGNTNNPDDDDDEDDSPENKAPPVNHDSMLLDGVRQQGTQLSGFIATDAISRAVGNAVSTGLSGRGAGAGGAGGGAAMLGGPRSGAASGQTRVPKPVRARETDEFSEVRMGLGADEAVTTGGSSQAGGRFGQTWIDVRGTGWDFDGNGPDGRTIDLVGGFDVALAPDLIAGILGAYHHLDYDFDAIAGALDGEAGSIGAYVGWQVLPSVHFSAGIAHTSTDYDTRAATAEGAFDASRWIAFAALTGRYRIGLFGLEPSVRGVYGDEDQDAFTDSLGTRHASRGFTYGELSAGARLTYAIRCAPGTVVTPFAGLYADWRFADESLRLSGITIPEADAEGGSLRLNLGLDVAHGQDVSVRFDSDIGGLGSGDYTYWTGRAAAGLRF